MSTVEEREFNTTLKFDTLVTFPQHSNILNKVSSNF